MPLICIGPVCIPISMVYGLAALLLKPIFDRLPKTWQIKIEEWMDNFSKKLCFWKKWDRSSESVDEFKEYLNKCCKEGTCAELKFESDYKLVQQMCVKNEIKSLFFFTGTECGPCKKMYPIFEPLPSQNKGTLFVKLYADELTNTTAKFQVTSLPTFIACDEEMKVIDSFTGESAEKLHALVGKIMKKDQ